MKRGLQCDGGCRFGPESVSFVSFPRLPHSLFSSDGTAAESRASPHRRFQDGETGPLRVIVRWLLMLGRPVIPGSLHRGKGMNLMIRTNSSLIFHLTEKVHPLTLESQTVVKQ